MHLKHKDVWPRYAQAALCGVAPQTMRWYGSPKGFLKEETILKALIKITLKPGVLDPQGKAIENALGSLGFSGVEDVRQGKFIEVDLAEQDEASARKAVEQMCEKLLANTVIENYDFELVA